MDRKPDLASAWAKLERAKAHINALRAEIEKAGAPDPELIPLRREYDAKEGTVVTRLDRVIQIRDNWPLLVGDAVHDLRCALDHMMWQLATVYFGRQPTPTEAKQIQYPEVRKLKDITGHRLLKYVQPADIERLKSFQPYRRLRKGELHPLPKLIRLSNVDKHRRLHLLVVVPRSSPLTNRIDAYRDCIPAPRLMPDGGYAHAQLIAPSRNPRAGDVILVAFVRPTGPNPDVEVDLRLLGFVGIGNLGPVVPMLDAMAKYVTGVLNAFGGA